MGIIIILDTSAIVEILRKTERGEIIAKELKDEIGITAFTVYELLQSRPKENQKILELIKRLNVFSFEAEHSVKAAEIKRVLRRRGKSINEVDLFIASIAIVRGVSVISCDKDFENIPALNARIF